MREFWAKAGKNSRFGAGAKLGHKEGVACILVYDAHVIRALAYGRLGRSALASSQCACHERGDQNLGFVHFHSPFIT